VVNVLTKHQTALITGLIVSVLVLAACGPSAAPPSDGAQSGAEKAPGLDELRKPGEIQPAAGQTGEAQAKAATEMGEKPQHGGLFQDDTSSRWNADPATGQTPYQTWYYIGEPMIRRNIKNFELEPGAFESWEYSADGTEITLKVRQGVKFHNKPPINGREMDANDLVYTMKSASGRQYPDQPPVRFPRAASYSTMKDVVALDNYTVKVTLDSPSVSFLHGLADYRATWVYPDQLRELAGGFDSLTVPDPEKHIGPGPFTLTEYTPDIEMVLDRNPDYWEQPKPYLDKVRVVFIRDAAARQAAFIAGKTDIFSVDREEYRSYVVENYPEATIRVYEPPSCWYRISLNTQRKPFDDNRVRKALYLVIDKTRIGKVVVGDWKGQQLWVWPGVIPFVFPEARSQEELAQHKYMQGPTPENVAEAKRLLKEAGYENGFEFEWHMSRTSLDEGQLIEQDWATHLPGVKAILKPVDSETHRTLASQGEYDAQLYCHIFDVTAVGHVTNAYHSKGGRNYGRNNDPELDAILDKAERTLDPAKYKELMRQAEDHIYESSLAMLPTHQNYRLTALQPGFEGVEFGPGTREFMLIKNWWWSNEEMRKKTSR
jgi:peptide/nickel transport system substrate-binding protein